MRHYHYYYCCCDEEEGVDLILILSFVGAFGAGVAVAVASLDCEGCGDEPRW